MPIGMLGSASTLGIGLAVYMDDQFTQGASKVSATLKAMGKDVDDFSQGMRTLDSIGQGLSRIGDRITGFAKNASAEFGTFEHSINATGIIAGLAKNDVGFQQLGNNALKLSGIYGQLPDDIAQAELEISKGGKSVQGIQDMTEAVIALGAATGTNVSGGNGTATVLLNIMQAYNASGKEALHYADIITSAANQSTIDVRDLFESLRYSADVASTLKIPFEETATAIATLGNAGLKGSMAGTAYANMLRYAEHGVGIFATKRQKTALDLMGISKKDMLDAKGHIIEMSDMLKLLKDRTDSFSDNDKLNVLEGIFGVRGNRALLNLLNGRDKDTHGTEMSSFDAMKDKIHQDTLRNVTQDTAQRMTDDQVGRMAKFSAAFSRLKIAIGGSLAPALTPIVVGLTSILTRLTTFIQGPVGSWLVRWGLIFGASLGPIGRMISFGARFAGFMVTSSGSITRAFSMARVAANGISTQFMSSARALSNAALQARGIRAYTSASGISMLQGAGRNGRFGTGVARTALGSTLGMIFGRSGLRFATTVSNFIAPLIQAGTWLGKTLGVVRIFGTVLGKALGWLFGWEGMLLDLVSTMVTGKGIFEWLWTGLKATFGWMFDSSPTNKPKPANIYHAGVSQNEKIDIRSPREKALEAELMKRTGGDYYKTYQENEKKRIIELHIKSDNKLVQKIDLNSEKQLASYSIVQ